MNLNLQKLKKVVSNFTYCMLAFFVIGSTTSANAQSPNVVQTPQSMSIDAYGIGTGTFNDWIDNFGFGIITPADGCGPATFANNYDPDNWNYGCSYYDGSVSVTFNYSDMCGNTLNFTRTFEFFDETPPTCLKTGDLFLNCEDENSDEILANWLAYQGTVTDLSHPISITNNFGGVLPMAGCDEEDGTLVTWTFVDACGNSSTKSAFLTIIDDTAPVLSSPAEDLIVECNDGSASNMLNTWLNNNGGATAMDQCSNVSWSHNASGQLPECNEELVVIFTASDVCGNTVTTSATFLVQDNTNPSLLNVPADLTTTCDAIPAAADVTATDNCSTNLMVTLNETTTGSLAECETDGIVITRTWSTVDACGNTVSETQIITVNPIDPNTEITLLPPPPNTFECSEEPFDFGTHTASTTCPEGGLNVMFEDETTGPNCNFTITRTYTATDACGNTATATQTFTVMDSTNPFFTFVPENTDVNCDSYPDGFGTPEFDDNCHNVSMSFVDELDDYICDADFPITRTWTIMDECGNTATASQTLTVWPDIEAPVFTFVPGDLIITCPEDPEFGTPTVVDNCTDIVVTMNTVADGTCPDGYTAIRTWTATDGCGNSTTASQTISVMPALAPIEFVFIPQDKTIGCGSEFEFDTPVCNGTCPSGLDLSFQDIEIQGFCNGSVTKTRNWVAIDQCGNAAFCSQSIIKIDNEAPEFETTLVEKTMLCGETPQFDTPVAFDQCSSVDLTFYDEYIVDECENNMVKRTWEATDACYNTALTTQIIRVEDHTNPTFNINNQSLTVTQSELNSFQAPEVFAYDECSNVELNGPSISQTSDTRVVYFWVAVDACDNKSSVSIILNTIPNTFPDNNIEFTNTFTTYPNPTDGILNVSFNSDVATQAKVEVIDMTGRLLYTQIVGTVVGYNFAELDLSSISEGAYIISIFSNSERATQKFVKLK